MDSADPIFARLSENVTRVRAAIASGCRLSGREPADVRLVAVTKYTSEALLQYLPRLGLRDFGESQVQQLVGRALRLGADVSGGLDAPFASEGAPRWHMIGHLQRNKVRALLPVSRVIHSLDSQRLAQEIEARAAALGLTVDALIEINISGEQSKQGVPPESAAMLAELVEHCLHIRLRGLMTMAPYDPDAQRARPHFARLRELLERLRRSGAVGPDCVHLSMGMSGDYAVAVEEGATIIRIGSALFDGLPQRD